MNNKNNEIDKKKQASLVFSSYLDTLGYNNGKWEFNFNNDINNLLSSLLIQESIISNFFSNGGFNINTKSLLSSDDTIMIIATKKACQNGAKIENFINEYLKILPELENDKRGSGVTTLKNLKLLKKYKSLDKIKYNSKDGGNGAAMRTSYIGLNFYKEENLDKLIELSIQSSRLTHNYPMGFLGGLVTALFSSYALRNIDPLKWCDLLLELEDSGKIDQFMKTTNIFKNYLKDKNYFWDNWRKYREFRIKYFFEINKPSQFSFSQERYVNLLNYTPGVRLKDKKTMKELK